VIFTSCGRDSNGGTDIDFSGFYTDTVTQIHPNPAYSIHDSIITKELIRVGENDYAICGGVCSSSPGIMLDSVILHISQDNSVTPVFSNPVPLDPGPASYIVPATRYIHITMSWSSGSRQLVERLKKN
jgi:hypothetical protein